ncbi:MAG TPA: HAD-IA family hydrolase, partial [Ignavibacteriaceae bacterium]|nr:HAD-IA family hydrolase [Ignavibacteriaceae bacterium]
HFIEYTTLYPGITDLLNFLVEKEIKVALLTTKAQTQAEMILGHFQLKKYFNYIMGRRPNIPHKPSPEPLKIILTELNVNPSEAIMIGDTEYDSRCGKSANAQTCLVTYGYRTEAQLKNESPDYLVNSSSAIMRIFS